MNLSTIFMIVGFLAVYVCLFLSQILPILLNKNITSDQKVLSKRMGLQLLSIKPQPKNFKLSISLIIFSVLLIFLSILMIKSSFQLALVALSFSITTLALIKSQYSKINGLYEKGIIYGDEIKWDKIHSWRIENNQNISILRTNGFRFTISELNYVDGISKILRENGIKEIV